jgi:hypothetical protein
MLPSFHVILPVFFMVTDTGYHWPATMDDGIVVDITCAFREEVEYADTAPGSIIVNRTSPTTRLIVLDFAKIFMTQWIVDHA